MPQEAAIGMLMAMPMATPRIKATPTTTTPAEATTRAMATGMARRMTTAPAMLITPPMADPPAYATPSAPFAPPAPGEARLRLFQLVSPALPVGAFSYSEGLEWLVQHGRLPDGAAVRAWLEAECRAGVLAIEAASLPELMDLLRRAGGDGPGAREAALAVREWESWLLAQREAPELRAQQRQMGGSLGQLLADLGWPSGCSWPWPLAWPTAPGSWPPAIPAPSGMLAWGRVWPSWAMGSSTRGCSAVRTRLALISDSGFPVSVG